MGFRRKSFTKSDGTCFNYHRILNFHPDKQIKIIIYQLSYWSPDLHQLPVILRHNYLSKQQKPRSD